MSAPLVNVKSSMSTIPKNIIVMTGRLFSCDLNYCRFLAVQSALKCSRSISSTCISGDTKQLLSPNVSLPYKTAIIFFSHFTTISKSQLCSTCPSVSRLLLADAKSKNPKLRSLFFFSTSQRREHRTDKHKNCQYNPISKSNGCQEIKVASIYSKADKQKLRVLGIETSCDDTGAAVLDGYGNILGEALNSQTKIHLQTGGIIPNIAKEEHAQNVEGVVEEALNKANIDLQGLDAIAVTVKPGLIMSLKVGLTHAKKLASISSQYLIPIHHMEAHALTARMQERIDFPFLVLLASGGHCLLALARDIDDFILFGTTQDVAPGEAFDKTARELKLSTLPEFFDVSGGVAVERMARRGNPHSFPLIHVMTAKADCNFSFTGLKIAARRKVWEEYERLDVPPEEVLPNAADVCSWFQYNVTHHMARRLQRAFIFADMHRLFNGQKSLVMSGGVASNSYIRSQIEHVCQLYDCQLICPPQKLCTDNGIMIAWNGVEKILAGRQCFHEYNTLDVEARSPFGIDISKEVSGSFIKLPKLKLPNV